MDSELAVQELTVDDEARDQAADDVRGGDIPDDVDAIVDGEEELGEDALDEVADALAAYVTLDEWLRSLDPADRELHDRILAEHPEVGEVICGSAASVDESDAETVRDQLEAGASLDQIADDVATLSSSRPGGECLARGLFRRQLVDLLYGTPVGSAGEKTVVSRSTGQPVVFFATPTVETEITGADLDDLVTDTLERLHDEGGAAFSELAYSTVDPDLDSSWGTWDPTVGVVAEGTPPSFSAFDLPEPTTTTTAAPPPPPPPPTESSEFAEGSEPTLAGDAPGDPGTGDLVARSQAALESVIPAAWRQALPVTLSIIEGPTSWSGSDGTIQVGSVHATGEWARLQALMGHEFGHQVGFNYGSQAEPGAAPTGWPPSEGVPVEAWADCVSGSYITYYPCGASSQGWTIDWMAPGPAAYPRTA